MSTLQFANKTIEDTTQRIGQSLWSSCREKDSGIFTKDFWENQMLERAMRDPAFKIELFRLIDVLPSLQGTQSVSKHVREYLLKKEGALPTPLQALIRAGSSSLTEKAAAKYFLKQMKHLAGRFIAGHDGASAFSNIDELRLNGAAFSADLLGEKTLSNKEAEEYQARYLELIDDLADRCRPWKHDSLLDKDTVGDVPRVNISLKVSSLEPHLDPVDHAGSVSRVKKRVIPILRKAKERGVFVNFDLEQFDLHNITYDLFEELALDDEFCDWPHLGIVVQAYLRNSDADLARIVELAKRRGCPLTVRLVKGAYWDYEVVQAQQRSLPCPVFLNKSESDAQFELLTTSLLRHYTDVHPAFASHNLRSIAHAIAQATHLDIPPNAYEFQCLYGMAEAERKALVEAGHRVRIYMPIGEYLPGMAYFIRRLLENTANEGFLRLSRHHGENASELLEAPVIEKSSTESHLRVSGEFTNAANLDFREVRERERFARALERWVSLFPLTVPIVVAGKSLDSENRYRRESPNDSDLIVAEVNMTSINQAEEALRSAVSAWPEWRDAGVDRRAEHLELLADVLERDRCDLAALQCYEVAKPWAEADADVTEAIDFCRYYAQRARVELATRDQEGSMGETNTLSYEGHGPAVVIAPWNFPLAILCGMSVAALVSGNTVILKPSRQSSAVAYELFKRMMEAGIPSEVVHFLPGEGEVIGTFLVEHPGIAQVLFTGSREVGLDIRRRCAVVQEGQSQLKRMVCEMGGKNAIIVDESADLDEAVKGVLKSCFGYAGQKCSACSRVIVLKCVYDAFIKRLIEATDSLHACSASLPECQLPPVVDNVARERLSTCAADSGKDVLSLYSGESLLGGYYVAPTIFRVDDPNHALMQDEYFGPIVAIHVVNTIEEAFAIASNTRYALTGGLYSRTPSHIESAEKQFRVGNLYLNRHISGAMVHRQPFGGFGMSGGGTKAGGPGYLLNFCDPRVLTENTMRHGFTPDIQT